MNTNRLLGLTLVCVQAAAIGYTSQTVAFPVCAVAAALWGIFSRWRYPLAREKMPALVLALFAVFLVKYLVAPHQFPIGSPFIRTELAHAAAQCLLTGQVIAFHLKRDGDRLPLFLPALGVMALACAGDVQVTDHERTVFQVLAIGFCALAALYFGSCRNAFPRLPRTSQSGRLLAGVAVLLLVASGGWTTATLLFRYERHVESLLVRLIIAAGQSDTVGFSGRARLGSVARQKTTHGEQVALRVLAGDTPGYLRGRAFDTFAGDAWQVAAVNRTVYPEAAPLHRGLDPEDDVLFVLDAAPSAITRRLEIWPENTPPGTVFVPCGAAFLKADVEDIALNGYGIVEAADLPPESPYTVYVAARESRVMESLAEKTLLAVPAGLDDGVLELAASLFAGRRKARDKISAVEAYFHANYQYELGIHVPVGSDPLTYFLLEKPAAHCEYFAAGAAVLLRLGGVPCRYVTGFVAAEKNAIDGSWVARNRDAHAWVEAYDEREDWVLVEATPSVGVPAPSSVSKPTEFWEAARAAFRRFRVLLNQGGMPWLASAGLRWMATRQGATALAGFLAFLALYRWYKVRRTRGPLESAELAGLHRLLDRMDARLRRLQLERRPGETLHQFAARISSNPAADAWQRRAAEWYCLYATLRYGSAVDGAALQELLRSMPP